MKRALIIFVLLICCGHILGQSDSLYEKSKSFFRSLDVNAQINKDILNKDQLYFIRQCSSNNEDFSHVLSSIAEMKPYILIYKVIFREIENKNIISFVQCESGDDIICEILSNSKESLNGCIIVNNAIFYIFNMLRDKSIINNLITKSDSYNVIMKMNYPQNNIFFYYNKVLPMYVEDKGHIYEYKNNTDSFCE